MSIKLEDVYSNLKNKYQLVQEAGEKGIYNYIEWVHIVEHVSVVPYLRNNELIITTGVAMDVEKELLGFCKGIKERGGSGLIVNIGPYIKSIPKEVIAYSDEAGFPLFSLPWEMQLTDLGRDLHKMIFKSERLEEIIVESFKDAIYFPDQVMKIVPTLEREGFPESTKYNLLLLTSEKKVEKENQLDGECLDLRRLLDSISDHYVLFVNDGIIVIALADFSFHSMTEVLENVSNFCYRSKKNYHLAVGPREITIHQLSTYYNRVKEMLRFSIKSGQKIIHYEELDIYKLLLIIDDKSILQELFNSGLGNLLQYDQANRTNYMGLLKEYFNCGFSKVDLASKQFLHRNTIQYQLTKIEEILNCDLKNSNDLFKLQLCFFIQDVI